MDIQTGITIAMGVLSIVAIGWSWYSVKMAEKYRAQCEVVPEPVAVATTPRIPSHVVEEIRRDQLESLLERGALIPSWAVGVRSVLANGVPDSYLPAVEQAVDVYRQGVDSVPKNKNKNNGQNQQNQQNQQQKTTKPKAQDNNSRLECI